MQHIAPPIAHNNLNIYGAMILQASGLLQCYRCCFFTLFLIFYLVGSLELTYSLLFQVI